MRTDDPFEQFFEDHEGGVALLEGHYAMARLELLDEHDRVLQYPEIQRYQILLDIGRNPSLFFIVHLFVEESQRKRIE